MRFQHGELHLVILALLGERPMHGYELMAELGKRVRRYNPSPGSIYPAIQALESEGLLGSRDDGDRRIYELSDEGRGALASRADRLASVEQRLGVRFGTVAESALGRLIREVRSSQASPQDVERVLDRATTEIKNLRRQ